MPLVHLQQLPHHHHQQLLLPYHPRQQLLPHRRRLSLITRMLRLLQGLIVIATAAVKCQSQDRDPRNHFILLNMDSNIVINKSSGKDEKVFEYWV